MYCPDKFICGGYFLVKQIPRPKDVSDFLPGTLLTLSDCFAEIGPDDWAVSAYNYDDAERAAEAAKFGIAPAAVPGLVDLFTAEIGLQHSNAFPNLAVAQAFYRECTNSNEVALLGIGLEPALLASAYAQKNDDVNSGYGLLERLELQTPLDAKGKPLGFEPLGFEATKFHSWLCHNAAPEAFETFGVRPNSLGFIDSLDDALRINQHLKSSGAEPGIWEPWLVVRYSTRSDAP
jgi:hypothetical protein